jgi:hypothetical protein
MTIWRDAGMGCAWLVVVFAVATARAGTIFDDDWTPPAPRKVTAPSPPASAPAATEVKPATPATPVSTPTPTPPAVAARRPVPGKADQAKSRTLFKQVFAKELADRAPAARRALAAKLLDEAAKVADVPADQFVLLAGAADAAREGGDLNLCARAADALATAYDVDPLAVKADAATKIALRADPPAVAADNCRAGLALVDELAAAEDYAAAARLLAALRPVAASDPALVAQLQLRSKDLDTLRAAAERLAPSLQRLKTSPDDPAANLAAGQFYCFLRGEWQRGLPMLAKGSDLKLKALATVELSKPADAESVAAIADGWWDVATARHDLSHGIVLRHAVEHYQVALSSATGLRRTAIQKRLEEANASMTPPTPASTAAEGPAGPRSVLLFVGNAKEKEIFGPLSNGKERVVTQKEMPAILADPAQAFGGRYAVVVWGRNVFREIPATDLSEAFQQAMQRFVRDAGGDLVFFEQYAQGNMDVVEKLFNVQTGGGAAGADILDPELKARAQAAGYSDQALKDLRFHNCYGRVPQEARVLLRGLSGSKVPTGVVVPVGKGRLILLGTNMDPADEKLDKEFFDVIYHYKSKPGSVAPAAAAAAPRSGGGPTYLCDLQESDAKLGHNLLKGGKTFNGASTAVNGEVSAHGLSTHALRDGTAHVEYDLGGRFRSFTAKVGIVDAVKHAVTPLTFRVVGDGKTLWESQPVKVGDRPAQSCAVDISGVKTLRLEVQCPGSNESAQAVWMEPQVK